MSFKFPSCQSEPGAPTSVVASAGFASATVSWTRPIQVGTSPISSYTVTSQPSVATPASCRAAAAMSCVFTGLTPGVPYTFRVTAANAVGTGPASNPSPPVTPLPLRRQVPVGGCVIVPLSIPRVGVRQLERPRCGTNAGQPVRVSVTGRLRGDLRYWKVIRRANGAVFIRTYGYHLKLTITWSAPAIGSFTAYRKSRTYRT
ncbi:MAG: fibronectin type III domain-containing protein [Actinomycetes bacterium]